MNTNTKLKFSEDVKCNSDYKRIKTYVTDPSKKDILKKIYISKDWLASIQIAFLYIQDPNKSWENYIDNIEYLQRQAIKKGTTFEPSYSDIAKVWKYKKSIYQDKRPEENNMNNSNPEIEQNLKLAKKNKMMLETNSIYGLQKIMFNKTKIINNNNTYIKRIKEHFTSFNNICLSEK